MNMEYINSIELKMPKTESDRNDGINDGNIETYKNMPMLSLTKEELQNSTDGAKRENGETKKVIVEFNDFYLERSNFPDISKTVSVFEDEKKYWDDFLQNDKKAVKFFENALAVLNKQKIRCLRISDFNTTGLYGINGKSTPWKNLVKNRGVSDKPGNYGGSFGIGKDAAFACSQIRTVFYATKTIQNEEAFQGVLKLPSYQKGDTYYDGFGFYSKKSEEMHTDPVLKCFSLDPSYSRNENGMDKYIIGFDDDFSKDDLKRELIISSINNFLYAFFDDKLEVKYDNVIVNQEKLQDVFDLYSENGIDDLTKEYFETLKNPQKIVTASVFDNDDVKIFVRLDPNASRRAAVVRQSGMKVFDKGYISGNIGFSAVVVLVGDKVNAYFKKLENAEHTQWSNDRAENKDDAKANQNKIFDKLRATINEMHQDEYETSIDADGLNEYLPFTYITGKRNTVESLSNEVENKVHAKRKKKNPLKKEQHEEEFQYEKDENGNIIEGTIHIGVRDGDTHEHNPNPEPNPDIDTEGNENVSIVDKDGFTSKKQVLPSSIDFRLIEDSGIYKLKFNSKQDIGLGFFEVMISAEQDNLAVDIVDAKLNGNVTSIKGNKILITNIEKNIQNELVFKIAEEGEWALEVLAYESEK